MADWPLHPLSGLPRRQTPRYLAPDDSPPAPCASLSPPPFGRPFPCLSATSAAPMPASRILAAPDAPLAILPPVATADHPDIESAIAASLPAGTPPPRTAIIAVAGPIRPDDIDLTNADWIIRPASMFARTGLEEIVLLNDFEAQALSLTALSPADLAPIGGGIADPSARKGRPRTRNGPRRRRAGAGRRALRARARRRRPRVARTRSSRTRWRSGRSIEPEHGRISAEAVLCGRGLLRLYRAVCLDGGRRTALREPRRGDGRALRPASRSQFAPLISTAASSAGLPATWR